VRQWRSAIFTLGEFIYENGQLLAEVSGTTMTYNHEALIGHRCPLAGAGRLTYANI
jgi:hypothetical protein